MFFHMLIKVFLILLRTVPVTVTIKSTITAQRVTITNKEMQTTNQNMFHTVFHIVARPL
jgi:hypothetical protein